MKARWRTAAFGNRTHFPSTYINQIEINRQWPPSRVDGVVHEGALEHAHGAARDGHGGDDSRRAGVYGDARLLRPDVVELLEVQVVLRHLGDRQPTDLRLDAAPEHATDGQSTRVLQRYRLRRPLLDRLEDVVGVEEALHLVLRHPALRLAGRHVTTSDQQHAHERYVAAADAEREWAVSAARARREVAGDGDARVHVSVGAQQHGDNAVLVGLVLGEDHAQCDRERPEAGSATLVRVGAAAQQLAHDADAPLRRRRDHRRQADEAHDIRVLAGAQQDVHAVVVALERGEAQGRAVEAVEARPIAAGVDELLQGARSVVGECLHERSVARVVLDLGVGTARHQHTYHLVRSRLRRPVQGRLAQGVLQAV